MSKAFILIPGARLPEGEAQRILSSLPKASARALSSLGEGAGQVVAQVLDAGCYRRAPHLSWLWRVITRRNSTPHEAPWRWLSLGGREQAPELWCLTPLSLENGHVLAERPELEEREFMELTFAIEPVFLKAGLRVQIWDTSWFLTRREDWAVTTAPAMALPGLMLDEAPVEGEAAEEVKGLLREVRAILADHPVNAARRAAGRHAVDALWISAADTRSSSSRHAHPQRRLRRRRRPRLGQCRRHPHRTHRQGHGPLARGAPRRRRRRDRGPLPRLARTRLGGLGPRVARGRPQGRLLQGGRKEIRSRRRPRRRLRRDGAATLAPAEAGLMERLFRRKSSVEPAAWCPDRYEGAVQ